MFCFTYHCLGILPKMTYQQVLLWCHPSLIMFQSIGEEEYLIKREVQMETVSKIWQPMSIITKGLGIDFTTLCEIYGWYCCPESFSSWRTSVLSNSCKDRSLVYTAAVSSHGQSEDNTGKHVLKLVRPEENSVTICQKSPARHFKEVIFAWVKKKEKKIWGKVIIVWVPSTIGKDL